MKSIRENNPSPPDMGSTDVEFASSSCGGKGVNKCRGEKKKGK